MQSADNTTKSYTFKYSAGAILVVTGVAKIWSRFGSAKALALIDPITGFTFRQLMWAVATAEIVVTLACFFSRRQNLALGLVALLATDFLVYRVGLWWIGWHRPCNCLGSLTDALHISPQAADNIMKVVLAYLLIGSYGLLIRNFWRKRVGKQRMEAHAGTVRADSRAANGLGRNVGVILLFCFAPPMSAASLPPKSQLAEFIVSPPPIREMLVECHWYYRAAHKTNTYWVSICWQTNAYVFRLSNQKTPVFDLFSTNRDVLLTIRADNIYSVVANDKVLGLHKEQVVGHNNSGARDLVTPKVRGQETLATHALMVGFPLPLGALSLSNGCFLGKDDESGYSIFGKINSQTADRIGSVDITYYREQPERLPEAVARAALRYSYGGDDQPDWFPKEIVREGEVDGRSSAVCRFVVHRLELGSVPTSEFYAERFLSGPAGASISTANGISSIALNGMTKQVLDPRDPRVGAHTVNPVRTRVVRVFLGTAALGAAVFGIVFWLKRRRFYT